MTAPADQPPNSVTEPGETLRIARILAPISTLGPGRRVAVWVQGCTLACPGCASTDTWDPHGGTLTTVSQVAATICRLFCEDRSLTGLTITGGEPLQQPVALTRLLRQLRSAWDSADRQIDVALFTGYRLRAARGRGSTVLDVVDLVIAGPYRAHAGHGGGLRASANQQIEALTELGRTRLAGMPLESPTMQVAMDGENDLLLVGLPRPGDLDRMRGRLSDLGVILEEVSWQP